MGDTILGIDLSGNNGKPHVGKLREAGVRFCYLKATEGMGYSWSGYDMRLDLCRYTGTPVGAYHFAQPDRGKTDPEDEARRFVAAARVERGDLPPALDLEVNRAGMTPKELISWALRFARVVEGQCGCLPVIYTYHAFWKYQLGKTTELAHLPLWLAAYSSKMPEVQGWDPVIWQYTAKGEVDGIGGRVDLNKWLGDESSFRAFRVS